jgi:(R,R)-butanediol dehydrogenase/meso-butanediol dehydrogenase/diacetyl reductase
MHDVRRARVEFGDRVLVVGAGVIGQFTAQAARLCGAHVTIVDRDEARLAVARHLGAQNAILPDEKWQNVKNAGPFDVVLEDSGAPILDHIVGANYDGVIAQNGRVVLVAGRDRVDYRFNCAQWKEIGVLHAGHFTHDDLSQVARLAAEGALKFGPVIKDVVRIEKAVSVYERLRDDPSSLFGTVFDWR